MGLRLQSKRPMPHRFTEQALHPWDACRRRWAKAFPRSKSGHCRCAAAKHAQAAHRIQALGQASERTCECLSSWPFSRPPTCALCGRPSDAPAPPAAMVQLASPTPLQAHERCCCSQCAGEIRTLTTAHGNHDRQIPKHAGHTVEHRHAAAWNGHMHTAGCSQTWHVQPHLGTLCTLCSTPGPALRSPWRRGSGQARNSRASRTPGEGVRPLCCTPSQRSASSVALAGTATAKACAQTAKQPCPAARQACSGSSCAYAHTGSCTQRAAACGMVLIMVGPRSCSSTCQGTRKDQDAVSGCVHLAAATPASAPSRI